MVQEHIYIQSNTLNLEDYIKKFKPSCSQFSMVFFAFSIIQGLRCLKDYKIAHLDLKPSNVMIGKKMTVKLIDFGESYYPELKSTHFIIKIINLEYLCLIVPLKTILFNKVIPTRMMFSLLGFFCIICWHQDIPSTFLMKKRDKNTLKIALYQISGTFLLKECSSMGSITSILSFRF